MSAKMEPRCYPSRESVCKMNDPESTTTTVTAATAGAASEAPAASVTPVCSTLDCSKSFQDDVDHNRHACTSTSGRFPRLIKSPLHSTPLRHDHTRSNDCTPEDLVEVLQENLKDNCIEDGCTKSDPDRRLLATTIANPGGVSGTPDGEAEYYVARAFLGNKPGCLDAKALCKEIDLPKTVQKHQHTFTFPEKVRCLSLSLFLSISVGGWVGLPLSCFFFLSRSLYLCMCRSVCLALCLSISAIRPGELYSKRCVESFATQQSFYCDIQDVCWCPMSGHFPLCSSFELTRLFPLLFFLLLLFLPMPLPQTHSTPPFRYNRCAFPM